MRNMIIDILFIYFFLVGSSYSLFGLPMVTPTARASYKIVQEYKRKKNSEKKNTKVTFRLDERLRMYSVYTHTLVPPRSITLTIPVPVALTVAVAISISVTFPFTVAVPIPVVLAVTITFPLVVVGIVVQFAIDVHGLRAEYSNEEQPCLFVCYFFFVAPCGSEKLRKRIRGEGARKAESVEPRAPVVVVHSSC
jgi:hypothetical protein